uniref:Uncharacterized protein n=1 Tax=Amblyomma maculatum TaxID=34609 RepID=G3MNH5_AMBMU
MYRNVAVGLLFLFVSLKEGASTAVNLTTVADKFIEKMASEYSLGDIDTWSLKADYDYWKGRHYSRGEHPIQANVTYLRCENNEKGVESGPEIPCRETFTWNISRGMESPFQLLVNVTIPMLRKSNARWTQSLQLDINNATVITRHLDNRIKREKPTAQRRVTMSCRFEAQVTFEGYFAFHVHRPRGDNPHYHSVNVVSLENDIYHLEKQGKHLMYNVTGEYVQTLCRYDDIQRKKRSLKKQ